MTSKQTGFIGECAYTTQYLDWSIFVKVTNAPFNLHLTD